MPVILAIVSDDGQREALRDALERRFGADYEVIVRADGSDLSALVDSLDQVVVALAPIRSADFQALDAVQDAHRSARRIALIDVGDTSVAGDLRRALTLNRVDYYVGQPWATPEEELYPVVGEALRAWSNGQRRRFDKATVVGVAGHDQGQQLVAWLDRNGVAARFVDASSDAGAELLAGPLGGQPLPAVLLWDGRVLAEPTADTLAEALGARTRPAGGHYDVAIVGAGPAGLAAAVYAASEGLRAALIEGYALGGQAGTSAKIRNYLGFPWGVSGGDLTMLASRQAEQLGAEFIVCRTVTSLAAEGDDRVLTLDNGDVVRCRSVIAACGVSYRRLDVPSVDALIGHGVFYGAAASEAASMGGLRAFVLGGGNSAGQAAAHMAKAGADVTVLIRGDSLTKSMSDYLVQQLTGTPNISVRFGVQVTGATGEHQLAGLAITDTATGDSSEVAADALFIFIGARPNTDWMRDVVDLDAAGFVRTGEGTATWLETSMPGVFAVGDIRAGSIKRVAAAVGEGSTAAMLARELLQRSPTLPA